MPKKLEGVDLRGESGWAKFAWSKIYPGSKRIYYRFNCSFKPIFCQSHENLYPVELGDKYLLNYFDIVTDISGQKLRSIYLGPDQNHPHKHPETNSICLGRFEGTKICKQLIPLLLCCLLKYDRNDCYSVPNLVI